MKKVILALAAAVLLAGAAWWAFCPKTSSGSQPGQDVVSASQPEGVKTSTKEKNLPENVSVTTASGILAPYDFAKLSSHSALIVYGRVSKIHDSILLKDSYGGVSTHTDVEIEPQQVFRGEAEDKITLRLSGGLVDGRYTEYPEQPELLLDGEYLFFLRQPDCGAGVYAKGDYYYLTGVSQGVFCAVEKQEEKAAAAWKDGEDDLIFVNSRSSLPVRQLKGMDEAQDIASWQVPASEAVLSLHTLERLYPAFNKEHPVGETGERQESLEAYQGNLENGMITQEEYDELVASLDEYAEEITPEQAEELEKENQAEKDRLKELVNAS